MFKNLDPILRSQVRLAIMTILLLLKSAEFSYLLANIKTTKRNLSFQIAKLKDAGYIEVRKPFKNNYLHTTLKIAPKGINAYELYIESISEYFKKSEKIQ
ncbi:MAG: transcriptional regulator [Draconibacterium sp.]